MASFMNSWWFLAVKATLLAAVASILSAQAHGDVTLPAWLAPFLSALYGVMQVGTSATGTAPKA